MRITFLLLGVAPGMPDSQKLSIATEGASYSQGDQQRAWENFRTRCIVHGLTFGFQEDGTIVISGPRDQLTSETVTIIRGHIEIAFRLAGLK